MNHRYILPILSAMLLAMFTSCLNDDDKKDADYNDTAVISFVLGQLDATIHTTSSQGEDSTYRAYVDGRKFPVYIDHVNCRIYNVDSLPAEADMKHVLVNLATKNNCYALWRSLTEDRLLYHSSEDSLDFSVPRELYVFTTDGAYYRKYDVSITQHKQKSDMFHWNRITASTLFATLAGMRAASAGSTLYVAGDNGSQTVLYCSSITDGKTWTPFNVTMPGWAWQTLVVHQGKPHLTDMNGTLYVVDTTDDGAPQSMEQYSVPEVSTLVGSDGEHLYAISKDGNIIRTASANDYSTWTVEEKDDDGSLLPTAFISSTLSPLRTSATGGRMVMVGLRSIDKYPHDNAAMIWAKVTGEEENATPNKWLYYSGVSEKYSLPALHGLTTIGYGTDIIALGGKPLGTSSAEAFAQFYRSIDGGVTWKADTRILLPADFESSSTSFAMTVDKDNYVWVVCGQSGQIWRGRLNQMGWNDTKKEFFSQSFSRHVTEQAPAQGLTKTFR